MTPFDRSHTRYWSKITFFHTPPPFDPLLGGSPSAYCHIKVWRGKLEWCGYPTVKKFKNMITCVDTIHEHDRQQVRRTDRHYTTA